MQLVVWVFVAAFLALMGRRNPLGMIVVVLLLRLAMPSTAGYVLTGRWEAYAAIHPSTILLLFVLAFTILEFRSEVSEELRARAGEYYYLGAFVVLYMSLTLISSGPMGTSGLINVVVAPMFFYFVVNIARRLDPESARTLILWFIGACVVETAIAILQFAVNAPVFWTNSLAVPFVRPMGTLDSPLDLGFVLAVATPLLTVLRSSVLRVLLICTFGIGIITSESRTPTVVFAIVAIVVLWRPSSRNAERSMGVVALAVGAVVALRSGLAEGILFRVQVDDGNSSFQRSIAFEYAKDNIERFLFLGNGWGSTFGLKGSILRTSLENGFLTMAFDVGVIAVAGLAVVILMHLRPLFSANYGSRSAALAVLVAVALATSYSGLVTMSASAIVLWLVMSLATSAGSTDGGAQRRPAARLERWERL